MATRTILLTGLENTGNLSSVCGLLCCWRCPFRTRQDRQPSSRPSPPRLPTSRSPRCLKFSSQLLVFSFCIGGTLAYLISGLAGTAGCLSALSL